MNLRGAGPEFVTMMKKEYPESLRILQDKESMITFMDECSRVIKKSGIKYAGIEKHDS